MEIYISVRNFVEFLLREGDIDNRKAVGAEDAMLEGSRIHRMIQKSMGSEYRAEVPLRHVITFENYSIVMDGRADGIIEVGQQVTIDEIKSTYRELKYIQSANQVHLAQAKCYAYIYSLQKELREISVRITYCNIDTEEIKYFYENYTFEELEKWYLNLIMQYKKWSDYSYEWKQKRKESIKQLEFPYAYREGQKELAGYVYTTLVRQKKLFIQAPTGVGKTLSTVFPTVKAIGEDKADRVFYLTAKTITRTVAKDTFDLLRLKGLQFKTVILTAKEKICFCEETNCNPEACPYAKGHFERINDAIYDLLITEDDFNRDVMEAYARKHRVCPFEMSLDMSLFADGIICDYNYLFDPYVYLRRFFTEGIKGEYYFLVDEAHNLLERGREMYSATLVKEDFLELKKTIKDHNTKLERYVDKCNKELLLLKKECADLQVEPAIGSFVMALTRLHSAISTFLEENEDCPVKEEILSFYFEISRFLDVNEQLDENYLVYSEYMENGSFRIKEFCINPAKRLKACMDRGKSTVMFSATFLPIQYYKGLLGGDKEDYEVYATSTFDPAKRELYIGTEVTSKYTRRGQQEYYNIARYIKEITKCKTGNYMIFFPSHQFLEDVFECYREYFFEDEKEECILQTDFMDEKEREEFLQSFQKSQYENTDWEFDISDVIKIEIDEMEETEKSLLGFCVLGGIFSEGIDLKNDSLIGAIIVGTGLPQVCHERELIKQYFDEQGKNGFDYAYRYPGMNKVLQAAGRVIRTAEDVGIVALLDERFMDLTYRKLFPREWEGYEVVRIEDCKRKMTEFWNRNYKS